MLHVCPGYGALIDFGAPDFMGLGVFLLLQGVQALVHLLMFFVMPFHQ